VSSGSGWPRRCNAALHPLGCPSGSAVPGTPRYGAPGIPRSPSQVRAGPAVPGTPRYRHGQRFPARIRASPTVTGPPPGDGTRRSSACGDPLGPVLAGRAFLTRRPGGASPPPVRDTPRPARHAPMNSRSHALPARARWGCSVFCLGSCSCLDRPPHASTGTRTRRRAPSPPPEPEALASGGGAGERSARCHARCGSQDPARPSRRQPPHPRPVRPPRPVRLWPWLAPAGEHVHPDPGASGPRPGAAVRRGYPFAAPRYPMGRWHEGGWLPPTAPSGIRAPGDVVARAKPDTVAPRPGEATPRKEGHRRYVQAPLLASGNRRDAHPANLRSPIRDARERGVREHVPRDPAPVAEERRRSVECCPLWGARGRRPRQPRDTRRYARNATHQATGPANIPRDEYLEGKVKVRADPREWKMTSGVGQQTRRPGGQTPGNGDDPRGGTATASRGGTGNQRGDEARTIIPPKGRGAETERPEGQRRKRQGAEGERHNLTIGRDATGDASDRTTGRGQRETRRGRQGPTDKPPAGG